MTLAEKLTLIAENQKKIYDAGSHYTADASATSWAYFDHSNHHNDRVARLKYNDTANGIYFNSMCERSTELEYIPEINTSNGETFAKMCYDNKSLLKNPNIDTSKGKYFSYMHNCCSAMETTPRYDLSKGELFNFMYWNCHMMKDPVVADVPCGKNFEGFMYNSNMIPTVALTNMNVDIVENTKGMFSGCHEVTEISGAVMGKNGGAAWMFRGCGKLHTIKGFKINPQAVAHASDETSDIYPMKGIKNVWDETFEWCHELVNLEIIGENKWSGLNLKWCKKLSKESITNVINTLSDNVTDKSITLSIKAVDDAFEDHGSAGYTFTMLCRSKPNWTIAFL